MERGIKDRGGDLCSVAVASAYHEHYPGRTAHHAEDALHPYIHDKAFDRGAPDRPSPHAPPF